MLGQFSHWRCLIFFSISFSPLLLPKPSPFPAYHQTYLREMTISDSYTVGSLWNWSTIIGTHFWTISPLKITKTCQSWEKYPLHRSFFFSSRNPKPSQHSILVGCFLLDCHSWKKWLANYEPPHQFMCILIIIYILEADKFN